MTISSEAAVLHAFISRAPDGSFAVHCGSVKGYATQDEAQALADRLNRFAFTPIPQPAEDVVERAARIIHADVFPEDAWEDCPGLHEEIAATARRVLALSAMPPTTGDWVMVPREPTEAMVRASPIVGTGLNENGAWSVNTEPASTVWRAMIAAAPPQTTPSTTGAWQTIESAPRDGTIFLGCDLNHSSFGSWAMFRRVRHAFVGGWLVTKDLGGWIIINDVEPDYQEGHDVGPDPELSIAQDSLNTSVRYGWLPIPSPTTNPAQSRG